MKVPLIDLQAQYHSIENEIRTAINEVLESQSFILGPNVSAFEQEIAERTTARFAIACASGTDALLLSLAALNVGPGDEVITTAYSFFATAGTIAWLGATPVFVDIDPQTYLLNADEVVRKITSRTKAIIGVHLFGQCCDMEALLSTGIPVIEDAAQAIGVFRNGRAAGSIGITGCFSFFPTKNLGGYGDGGMITTNDESMASRLRKIHKHGEGGLKYNHEILGTNSRLDELQAAVLRVKLKHLKKWNEQRIQNAMFYRKELSDLPLQLPVVAQGNTTNFHQFVIQAERRDELKDYLASKDIGTAVYYPKPLPFQPCFKNISSAAMDFPSASKAAMHSLALPVFPELSQAQKEYVVEALRSFSAFS